MPKENLSADDSLRQLLRESAAPAQGKTAPGRRRDATSSEVSDLKKLLQTGPSSMGGTSSHRSVPSASGNASSITDLLKQSTADTSKSPSRAGETSLENSNPSEALNQLLKYPQKNHPVEQAPTVKRPQPRTELNVALQDNRTRSPLDPLEGSFSVPSWLGRVAALLALMLGLLTIFYWPRSLPDGPAGTLLALAKQVEQYRHTTGDFPEQLAKLDAFPKEAIEWPVKFWNARDAQGRTEIIWVREGSQHYSILVRQGADVWIYRDKEGQPRQVKK